MNRQKLTTVLGFTGLLICIPALAEVYMEKDADGNVVFTDRPVSEKAKPVDISPMSTYSAPDTANAAVNSQPTKDGNPIQRYEFLTISSPANDEPVRANDGSLAVSIDLAPGLQAGHHFVLLMDGNPVDENNSPDFSLQNVDRGTHSLRVQIVDDNGNEILSSDSVTFHMLRI